MTIICCVKGCGKQRFPGCGVLFHRIPEIPEVRRKWLKAIPLDGILTKNSTVCSNHFENDDYISPVSNDQNFRVLKLGVVPSIFTEVESIEQDSEDEQLATDNVITFNLNKPSNSSRPANVLAENKIDDGMLGRRTEGNKIMIINPISTVNKIEDVITIKPDVRNEDTQSSSGAKTTGTSVIGQVGGILNNLLTQKNINKIIVVKPIAENGKIEEVISAKSITNRNDSDISSGNVSSDSENPSGDEELIPFREEIYIKEPTPERTSKRKYAQETPIDMYGSKVPRYSATHAKETNITQIKSENPNKHHMSTQTGKFTTSKEDELKKKIQVIKQKIHRREVAFKQMNTILNLIKNKCRSYAEVKQVLTLKIKQLPENLNCDGVIVAP